MTKKIAFRNVIALHSAGKALLCFIAGAEIWIPFSQIDASSEVRHCQDRGTLVISSWLAARLDFTANARHPSTLTLEPPAKIYRRLVAKYHPDRNPGAADVMRDINELYQAMRAMG